MTALSRRHVLAAAAATVAAASLPAAVAAVDVSDPVVERIKMLFGQLLGLLRADGFAIAKLGDGGRILFWLDNRQDIASMRVMSLEDDATPNVIEVLERTAAIEPTMVRL
jgi:hypothetical protein